jgi:tetratricopeptide (TPR) repeat protein
VGAALCQGLARLARASSPEDRERAAGLILDGWRELRPLCEAADPACGPHVAEALGAAARAYEVAGRTAKAIGLAKLVVDRPTLPGGAAVAPVLALELGDRYFALGIFEIAADWYARHARLAGIHVVAPAADRALGLYAAFANVDAATKLADELSENDLYSAAQRARWVVSAAVIVRAVHGPGEAATWLQKHRPLLDQAGATSRAEDASRPLPEAASSIVCAAPLSCAVKRLVAETW